MKSTKLGQGGFGCTYYPPISCNNRKCRKNKKGLITKVESGDKISIFHEIELGKEIQKIKNYQKYFAPVVDYSKFTLKKINNDIVEDCDIITKDRKNSYALHIPLVEGYTFDKYFLENITDLPNNKLMNDFMTSYEFLLTSFGLLSEKNISHCDVKPQNIMYNTNTSSPVVIDFGLSIQTDKVKRDMLDFTFYTFAPSYGYWSPEFHVCCYMNKNMPLKITSEMLQTLSETIINENHMLARICKVYSIDKRIYIDELYESLEKYIDKSSYYVIYDLLEYSSNSWDLWSLHFMYLYFLSYMEINDNKFLFDISEHFLKQLTFNHEYRSEWKTCIESYKTFMLSEEYSVKMLRESYTSFDKTKKGIEDIKGTISFNKMER